jgi:hypothetical protein
MNVTGNADKLIECNYWVQFGGFFLFLNLIQLIASDYCCLLVESTVTLHHQLILCASQLIKC